MKKLRPPEHAGGEGEEIWLISYADMVTLLMGFFALLLSFSKVDPAKLENMKKSTTEVFGGEYKLPYADLTQKLKEQIDSAKLSDQVFFEQTPAGITVTFRGALFFDSGSAALREEATTLLNKVIPVIKSRAADFNVVIEGHTDNNAISSSQFASNWELSSIRACSVLRAFESQGFSSAQLTAIGWGDTKPVMKNDTPEGRAQNRRVVIKILRK